MIPNKVYLVSSTFAPATKLNIIKYLERSYCVKQNKAYLLGGLKVLIFIKLSLSAVDTGAQVFSFFETGALQVESNYPTGSHLSYKTFSK